MTGGVHQGAGAPTVEREETAGLNMDLLLRTTRRSRKKKTKKAVIL